MKIYALILVLALPLGMQGAWAQQYGYQQPAYPGQQPLSKWEKAAILFSAPDLAKVSF